MPSERILLVEHKGKQVLLVDLSGLVESELPPLVVEASSRIRTFPLASALTLTDATSFQFTLRDGFGGYDRVVAETIRSCFIGNRPHVRAAAIALGHDESQRVITEFFNRVSERHFEIFHTVEDALDWLVEQ